MPNNLRNKEVILLGAGYMASEYLKVLHELKCEVIIVGKNQENINKLKHIYPDFKFFSGGIESYIKNTNLLPKYAINTVNIEYLEMTTKLLVQNGSRFLLMEKPGSLFQEGCKKLSMLEEKYNANIYIGYNRRFLRSIEYLKENISIDGGVSSCHFEFCEWFHRIQPEIYTKEVLNRWLIANSSHVIDTVFNLIGYPKKIYNQVYCKNYIEWHKSGSIFIGSGISEKNIPFTYHSNWTSAGRWSIEILTNKNRYYLAPIEELRIQQFGSTNIERYNGDYEKDTLFKPGLYEQTKSFLNGDCKNLMTLNGQQQLISNIEKIGDYNRF